MGEYEDVLASLETLNHSVLKAMGYTKKVSGCRWPMGVQGLMLVWFQIFSGHPSPRVPGFVMTSVGWAWLWGGLCLGLLQGAEVYCDMSRVAP